MFHFRTQSGIASPMRLPSFSVNPNCNLPINSVNNNEGNDCPIIHTNVAKDRRRCVAARAVVGGYVRLPLGFLHKIRGTNQQLQNQPFDVFLALNSAQRWRNILRGVRLDFPASDSCVCCSQRRRGHICAKLLDCAYNRQKRNFYILTRDVT